MNIFETLAGYFQFPFVRYALIAGVLIALCSSLLGVTLVLKRFSFIGDGLSHVAFGAMAIATVVNVSNDMLIVMPVTILSAILLLRKNGTKNVRGDAALAMISVGALAVGYLILNVFSKSANLSGDVCSTLFGSTSILTLKASEVWLCVGMSILVLVVFTLFYMHPVKREDGKLTSGVYRFALDEENVDVKNNLQDRNLFAAFVTQNPACQYGVDGIALDQKGDLYIGNFGDGAVHRLVLGEDGALIRNELFAQDAAQLQSTDGMIFDDENNLYIADFCANAIVKVTPDGNVMRIAQSPDCTGVDGGLDQPGEPIIWDGKLIASCFDLVTGPGKVNKKHEMPATLVSLTL